TGVQTCALPISFLLFFKTDFVCVCLLVQCPEATPTQLKCLRQTDRQTDRQTNREGRARCRPSTRARGHVEGTLGFLFNSYKSFAFYERFPWRETPPSLRYFWKLCFGGASPVCLKSSLFPVLLSVPLVRFSLFLCL